VIAQPSQPPHERYEPTLDAPPLPDSTSRESTVESTPWSLGGFPIIFFSEETGWAFGAGGQLVHKMPDDDFSSTLNIGMFYSQKKQYNVSLAGEMYIPDMQHKISGDASAIYWPDVFYGIGNDARKEDEETFTTRMSSVRIAYQYNIYKNIYAGGQFYHNRSQFSDQKSGGLLATAAVPGSEGGSLSSAGLIITWDTRNNNIYPTSGSYHQLMTFHGGSFLSNEFTYSVMSLDLRHYMPLPEDRVIGFRAVAWLASGDRPFYQLSRLGNFLRGYFQPRIRDRNLYTIQAEFRTPVIWRFGAVAFAGFGQVAPRIGGFSLNAVKPSLGLGIRFALIPDQKVNLRIDYGIGKGDSSFDMTLLESF
jgi:outer membrane protein assembly factor BamA